MDELKKTKELVEKYLKKKYPDAQFTDEDLEFLARYSVKKEGCESKILKELGHKGRVQDYYAEKRPLNRQRIVSKQSTSVLTPKEIAKRKRNTP